MDAITMKYAKRFALLAFFLTLTGCSSTSPGKPSASESRVSGTQSVWERDRDRNRERHRRNADGSCRKRGCDNDKLFFNPGESEPSVLDIHRGW